MKKKNEKKTIHEALIELYLHLKPKKEDEKVKKKLNLLLNK